LQLEIPMPDSVEVLDQKVVSSQAKLTRAMAVHEKAKSATTKARQAYATASARYERRERAVKGLKSLKGAPASGAELKAARTALNKERQARNQAAGEMDKARIDWGASELAEATAAQAEERARFAVIRASTRLQAAQRRGRK
jgi:hypothetical protein